VGKGNRFCSRTNQSSRSSATLSGSCTCGANCLL